MISYFMEKKGFVGQTKMSGAPRKVCSTFEIFCKLQGMSSDDLDDNLKSQNAWESQKLG